MGIWIRSQDKKRLINTSNLQVFGTCLKSSDVNFALGNYKSEERALEVLDQIHNVVARNSSRDYLSGKYRVNQNYVFEMPKE